MRSAAEFGRTVPLQEVVMIEPVALELYGAKNHVVNDAALSRLLLDAGIEEGYEEALAEVIARLDTVKMRS